MSTLRILHFILGAVHILRQKTWKRTFLYSKFSRFKPQLLATAPQDDQTWSVGLCHKNTWPIAPVFSENEF